jgi:hypothetical protein
MILFSIGLALKKFKSYPRRVGGTQKSAAKKFVETLGTGDEQERDALQEFLFELFTQDRKNLHRFTFTVYRFLILYSFRPEGRLAPSNFITQYISRIVFFGRATMFNKIRSEMAHQGCGYFVYVI